MLRLSKKADYALIALKFIASGQNRGLANARQIYEKYDLPPDLLAKILQKLAGNGIIESHHGSGGGYKLAKDPSCISLKDIVQAIDGPVHFLACKSRDMDCEHIKKCTIRKNLSGFDKKMSALMDSITLKDI